jgi:membrane protease YdiL (CAAX protease family)
VGALLLLLAVWSILIAGALAQPRLGSNASTLLSFLAAAALVAGVEPRLRPSGDSACLLALGVAAGFASYPAWITSVGTLGFALGLPIESHPVPPEGPALLVAVVLLAPIFEELLYRERLLLPLRRVAGSPAAVVATSVVFAASHVRPWPVLTAFLVGLFLGATRLAAGGVALCIGIHMGLNLAAAACGLPPARLALPAPAAAAAGLSALGLAIWLARRQNASKPALLAASP